MAWMSRSFLMAAAAAAALMCAAAPAQGAPKLSARVTACSSGTAAAERVAVFTGSMPGAKGADRLRMRFVLERREAGESSWSRVPAPTFGVWMRSRPGVAGFVYTKRVEGLVGPADYRAVVSFRWLARDGRVARSARRITAVCAQPDPRPNLVALLLGPAMSESGPVAELLVGNSGGGDLVTPAEVTLRIDGAEQPSQSLPALPTGETALITFPMAACAPGTTLEATLDPLDVVDEGLETDNRRATTCSGSTRWTRSLHSDVR